MRPHRDIEKLLIYNESFKKEIQETTDRACVIVAVAYLDDLLRNILTCFMTEVKDKENNVLFEGSNAPLASFSSKIKIAFRFGLISVWEHNTLESIRKIRNKFAHVVNIKSLDTPEIKGIVNNIKPDRKWLYPENIYDELRKEHTYKMPEIDENSCRDMFEKSVACLISNLKCRAMLAQHNKRKETENIFGPLDIHRHYIASVKSMLKSQLKSLKNITSLLNKTEQAINDCIEEKENLLSFGKKENDEEIKNLIHLLNEVEKQKSETEEIKKDYENEIKESIILRDFFIYLNKEMTKFLKAEKLY